jgi:hypothetical protein
MTTKYLARFVSGPRDGADEMMDAQTSGEPPRERRFPVLPGLNQTKPVDGSADDRPLVEVYCWRGAGIRRPWSFQQGDEEPRREWVYREANYVWEGYQ